MSSEDESELIAKAKVLDQEALLALWKKYEQGLVFRIVRGWLGWRGYGDHIPDIAQNVFVKFREGISGFDGSHPFQNWLSVIARNECVSFLRKQHDGDSIDDLEQSEPNWRQQLQFDRIRLAEALETLKPRDRQAMELYALGCSVPEVADRLGLTIDQVYGIFRALRKQRRRAQRKAAKKQSA